MAFPRGALNLQSALPGLEDPRNVKEALPSEMRMDKMQPAYSIITKRSRRTLFPNTRGTFSVGSGQQVINIPITTDGFLDCPTAVLNFDLTYTDSEDTNSQGVAPESAWSWIREIRVLVADQELERYRLHNETLSILKEGSMDNAFNSNQYSYSRDVFSGTKPTVNGALKTIDGAQYFTVPSSFDEYVKIRALYNNEAVSNTLKCQLPLYHLGFFRQQMYFPNRSIPVVLQIIMQDNIGRCVVTSHADPVAAPPARTSSNTALSVSRLRLNTDVVHPSPLYTEAVQALLAGSQDSPVVFPIETHQIQQTNINLGTASTETQFVYNLGLRYLKSLYVVQRPSTQITNSAQLKTAFPRTIPDSESTDRADVSLFINGDRYPELPMEDITEVYTGLTSAYNNRLDVESANNISNAEYEQQECRILRAANQQTSKPKFIIGFDLEQYHGAYGSRTGISTSSLGYALRLEGNFLSAEISSATQNNIDTGNGTTKAGDHECLAVFHFLKLMRVSGNVVEIVEP